MANRLSVIISAVVFASISASTHAQTPGTQAADQPNPTQPMDIMAEGGVIGGSAIQRRRLDQNCKNVSYGNFTGAGILSDGSIGIYAEYQDTGGGQEFQLTEISPPSWLKPEYKKEEDYVSVAVVRCPTGQDGPTTDITDFAATTIAILGD